jgi:anti-sigma factor RsiW
MRNSETDMTANDDDDRELLEMYLDDELSADQLDQFRARLATDPAVAAEVENLRLERQLRAALFNSLEGGEEAVVERALAEVHGLDQRHQRRAGQARKLRYAMAAAALIIVGFLVGWMGATGGKSNASASEPPYRVEILDESGQVMAVQKFATLEKAREFSDDLQQWQVRQERLLNGQVTVHSAKY